MKPSEKLDAAADLLTTHGWCRHHHATNDKGDLANTDKATHFCIWGAMIRVEIDLTGDRKTGLDYDAWQFLVDQSVKDMGPIHFNDRVAKSKEDVIQRLRESAAYARRSGK